MGGDGADKDVDGDCPLPMRGVLVMTMVMISPFGRVVSSVEQLCRSSRFGPAKVPPRGGRVSSRKVASDFFLDERPHIAEDGHQRATRGPTRQGARPPPSWVVGGPPQVFLPLNIFY